MATFAKNEKDAPRKPEAFIVLPPTAFADEWKDKPNTDVAVGLRRLSEQDEKVSKEQGRKIVFRDHVRKGKVVDEEEAWESYNQELIRYLMARAMCDVNDVSKPYFDFAEDTIHVALTSEGLGLVWDKWWMLKMSGPAAPVADDDAVRRLSRILANPENMKALGKAEKVVRKLLAEALSGFGELEVEDEEAELEVMDDGYVVTLAEEEGAISP
jgi:hypothetical protein